MHQLLRIAPLFALATLAAAPATAGESLSQPRQGTAAATLGDLAFFGGGRDGFTSSSAVDIYDAATGTWSTHNLSVARTDLAVTAVGSYVMFAGGSLSPFLSTDAIDIYDASAGPPSDPAAWSVERLTSPRFGVAATTLGTKAFFAGGGLGGPQNLSGLSDVVEIYDSSIGDPSNGLAWSTATLSAARGKITAAAAGNQAVFASGLFASSTTDVVDIYDETTNTWTATTLSERRLIGREGAAAVGAKIYFAGGQRTFLVSSVSSRIDVYDTQSGAWSQLDLPTPRLSVAAAAAGNTAVFAGGVGAMGPSDDLDMFNVITGVWDSSSSLSLARFDMSATSVGGKALFAGGSITTSGFPTAVVDLIEPYVGTSYCGPGVANSTGAPSVIEAYGSVVASANDVSLLASGMPASTCGFFVTSQTQGFTANPGGSEGNLCLDGAIGRYVGPGQVLNSGPAGHFELTLSLTLMSTPSGPVSAQAGQTWNFQAWHRDTVAGVATSNFTDAVSLTLR